MSCSTYDLCCKYQGQVVQIREHSGREHVGTITRVSNDRVFITPHYDHSPQRLHHYNSHFYQPFGYGYSIAIGFISGIILASLFFF